MKLRRRVIQRANQVRFALHARGRSNDRSLLVLAGPRTGSYLLLESLARIPGVDMKGEVINPLSVVGIRPGSRPRTLRHVRRALAASASKVAGAKLMLPQLKIHGLTPADLEEALPDVHWLIIYREHLLAQYVSYWRARASSAWRGSSTERDAMNVDPAHLVKWSTRMADHYQQALDAISKPAFYVSYEALTSDPDRVFHEQLLEFIGGKAPLALPPMSRAAGTATGADLHVANLDALVAELGGLPWLRIDDGRLRIDYGGEG